MNNDEVHTESLKHADHSNVGLTLGYYLIDPLHALPFATRSPSSTALLPWIRQHKLWSACTYAVAMSSTRVPNLNPNSDVRAFPHQHHIYNSPFSFVLQYLHPLDFHRIYPIFSPLSKSCTVGTLGHVQNHSEDDVLAILAVDVSEFLYIFSRTSARAEKESPKWKGPHESETDTKRAS